MEKEKCMPVSQPQTRNFVDFIREIFSNERMDKEFIDCGSIFLTDNLITKVIGLLAYNGGITYIKVNERSFIHLL